ncbi:hypothetical protein BU25DRAFT_83101 [Macroventuria anomochaeta]|uniref:Uncharacterized protein n=1 Tax=Macroventuria anomochaeta TaxID=301207 RepID=A0ACB6SF66_9PLEO|nr:uncharacterized protein BU25DRAFT_83101 [Macroventuria anomochaeta]KAF2632801.1 hypothetical protein BU25DRAFT_83101 [Macroventuria anomochaeta]
MDSSDPHAQTTNVNAYGTSNSTGEAFSNAAGDDSAALWPQAPVQLARGRQPRDALAKIIPYSVSSMDEFEAALREYLNAPPEQPEHTEAQLSFWIGTSFMVSAPAHPNPQQQSSQQQQQQQQQQPPRHLAQQSPHALPGYQPVSGFQAQYGGPSHAYQSVSDPAIALTLPPNFQQPPIPNGANNIAAGKKPEQKVSLSIMEALQHTADPKDRMRKQRAIAKCCVDAIQRIDGYRYSFHNCWNSREDDSFRFSYYCNDSLLNKDRAANGKGAKLGKRATKPVYDCKGVLSIKFSATKEALDVFYKHVPVHKTYEERAPPPRKDSKRRKFLEENDPEALARIVNRPKDDSAEPTPRLKKKKPSRPEPPRPSNTSLESDLRAQSLQSLLLLIRDDASAPPELPPPPEPESAIQQPVTVLQSPIQPPQNQLAQQQQRKRPRNSCDVCKAKKTKCDGVRPICQTCVDKKRQCFYSEPPLGHDRRQSMAVSEPVRQVPAPSSELSELEKMKKELEEAKARIQQLEQEKGASTTPVQTPQTATRPQSQPQPQQQPHIQPQQRNPIPHAQTQVHAQQQQQQQAQQRQQVAQNHRQQLQQLNQVAQRRNSPQQIAYNLDGQPVQQQQQQQQRLQSPQQPLQTAQQQQQQQLQTAAQAMPLQAQQTYFTAANHTPYGTLNRSMTQGSLSSQSAQNALSSQSSLSSSTGLRQTQQQGQLHNSGSLASGGSVDASSLYGSVGRNDLNWPPAAYYGYQSAQQQQQQDQWGAARGSNVFR